MLTNGQAIIFIGFGIFSYLLGYYLQNNKIKKIKSILFDHSILFAVLIFILGLFAITDVNLKNAAYTFSSVYLSFWLANEQKKRDEVRALKYHLGLLWEELRFNLHHYELLMKNFRFLFDNPDKIPLNAARMGAINTLAGQLNTEAHAAYVSSGAVAAMTSVSLPMQEKDELFNSIEIAYSNLKHLKSFLLTVSMDFNGKASLIKQYLNTPFAPAASGDMEVKTTDAARELMIARRSALEARDDVDAFLNKLGITQNTEELREDTLTDDDKAFIDGVIRREPVSPDEVFKTPEDRHTDY